MSRVRESLLQILSDNEKININVLRMLQIFYAKDQDDIRDLEIKNQQVIITEKRLSSNQKFKILEKSAEEL